MIKTTIIISAAFMGTIAAGTQVSDKPPVIADQTLLPIPQTESVIAQFSHLELIHNDEGFRFSVTDTTDVFLDLEFPGELHIRIGF